MSHTIDVDSSDTHVGATWTRCALKMQMPGYKISSAVLALSRAFTRSDEFSLESTTKARHRGDHRRRSVSRHASLSQRVRVAPKPSRELTRSRAFSLYLMSTPLRARDGVDSSETHVGAMVTQLLYPRPLGSTQFPLCEVEPRRVRSGRT
jgi:hypothetical protein